MKRRDTQSSTSSEDALASGADSRRVRPRVDTTASDGPLLLVPRHRDATNAEEEGGGATTLPSCIDAVVPITRVRRRRRQFSSTSSDAVDDDDDGEATTTQAVDDTGAERRRLTHAQDEAEGIGATISIQPRRLHRYRRSPRFACHFDGLAAVEVQSIMQMLDRRSLLRLARCNRRMHADADSDDAWRAHLDYNVFLNHANPDIGDRLRQSLLRHLPGARVWLHRTMMGHLSDHDVVAALTRIPRILSLMTFDLGLSPERWLQILSHPAAAGLTHLVCDDPLTTSLTAQLTTQLARLTRLEAVSICKQPTSGDIFAALPTLPSLTSLIMSCLDGSSDVNALLPSTLSACARLTGLDLGMPIPQSGGPRLFQCIFCGTSSAAAAAAADRVFLSRLQRLCLFRFDLTLVRPEEFATAFTSLTDLRHLTLTDVQNVDGLLPSVSRATNLTDLTICLPFEGDLVSTSPTSGGLRALLQANSSVDIKLYVPPAFGPRVHEFDSLDPHRFRLITRSID